MIKFFQKTFVFAAVLCASYTANAQTPVIDENFQNWQYFGYATDPGTQAGGLCESTSLTPANTTVPKFYTGGNVTYTLTECGVAPQCGIKGGSSPSCVVLTGDANIPGYVTVGKTATAVFSTSVLAHVSTVDLIMSWTGANRNGRLQTSPDGVTWTPVASLPSDGIYGGILTGGSCSQYGTIFTGIAINMDNVMLGFFADPASLQYSRIHSLKVYGSIVAGIQNASWSESGVSAFSESNNSLTVKSDNASGSLDVISMTGAVVSQKQIQKGEQSSIVVPSNGLYIVRFTSNNKVYTKKVAVN